MNPIRRAPALGRRADPSLAANEGRLPRPFLTLGHQARAAGHGRHYPFAGFAGSCRWVTLRSRRRSADGIGREFAVPAMTCRSASFSEAVITGARGTSEL